MRAGAEGWLALDTEYSGNRSLNNLEDFIGLGPTTLRVFGLPA
jgi:hypothetical protein